MHAYFQTAVITVPLNKYLQMAPGRPHAPTAIFDLPNIWKLSNPLTSVDRWLGWELGNHPGHTFSNKFTSTQLSRARGVLDQINHSHFKLPLLPQMAFRGFCN